MVHITNFFSHLFKIIFGVFVPDKKQIIGFRVLQIFSRFSWELPQTVLGLSSAIFLVLFFRTKTIFWSHGATVVQCKGRFGGFSLGCYIAGDAEIDTNPSARLFQHEYGHYLQSMSSGLIYLFKYALPSVISAWRNNFYGHAKHPVEQDANQRALAFWRKNYQHQFNWDYQYNPLYSDVQVASLKWYDFLPVYFPFIHFVKAFRK